MRIVDIAFAQARLDVHTNTAGGRDKAGQLEQLGRDTPVK